MEPRATLIYLFRHGETEVGAARRFVGQRDVPLSARGERECRAQAARLRGIRLAAVYSSDLIRARRTAEIIAEPHGLTPALVPELREMDMGRWDGLTAEEIQAREPEVFADWMSRLGAFAFPGGESLGDLVGRAWPAFAGLVAAHPGERIAVAAHGGTNRALLCRALGLPLESLLALGQDFGALTLLEKERDRWRLVRLNEAPVL